MPSIESASFFSAARSRGATTTDAARLERHKAFCDQADNAAATLCIRLVTSPQLRQEIANAIELWRSVGSPSPTTGPRDASERPHRNHTDVDTAHAPAKGSR